MNTRSEKLKRRMSNKSYVNNKDRWMVSYADFVTLLFGFFLTMYALSSINEGRYRVLAQSIAAAFANTKSIDKQPQPEIKNEKPSDNDIVIKKMSTSIVSAMTPWINKGLIKVNASPVMLQIDINASALFPSGSSLISKEAFPILESLADILSAFPNAIHVEGFTDNIPISTESFPSNWELSASRAATVVRMFGEIGIQPTRMASVGYGEFHPVADNNTIEGRSRNRRVVIVVLSGDDPRTFIDVEDASRVSSVNDVANLSTNNEILSEKSLEQQDSNGNEGLPLVPQKNFDNVFDTDDFESEEIPL